MLKAQHKNIYGFNPPFAESGNLATTHSRMYFIFKKIMSHFDNVSSALFRSGLTPNVIYTGRQDGLSYIPFLDGQWKQEAETHIIKDDIRTSTEGENGDQRVKSQKDAVWRIKVLHSSKNSDVVAIRF